VQDEAKAGRVSELGNAMEIGDEALGIGLLRPGEESLQRPRCEIGRAAQDVEVEADQPVPMPAEQAGEQLGMDGSEEPGIDELPEIDSHELLPGSDVLFLVCSIRPAQPQVEQNPRA
jgi:hypothetical protein